MDVLCSDKTGTLTAGKIELDRSLDPFGNVSPRPLSLAYLNSKYETGIRSPLDEAILQHVQPGAEEYTKIDEIPFDFERRRLSIVVESHARRMLITKGAPEGMYRLFSGYEVNGQVHPADQAAIATIQKTINDLSNEGFRVIAVAYADVEKPRDYSAADEQNLNLVGFLTFSDPPLSDAAEALSALKEDGVDIKIVSGDNDLVARHVCSQVGIECGNIVTGEEIDHMVDEALANVSERTRVFARISPIQKNRILHALKHNGHCVGFMGDGINDAPSLHAADVGISVSNAAEVARDAAAIILLEPGLHVLHEGILEGRKAFGNVMKYLLMGTSSNFGTMFSMAAASLFLPFLPMLPTQILLNNFLYDSTQIAIPTDRVDETYLRAPDRWDIALIRNFMVFIGPISSIFDFVTFYVLLHVFYFGEVLFHTGWFVESLVTQVLVVFILRTAKNPLRSRPSLPLLATSLTVVVIGILLPFSPLAHLLGFMPLPVGYFVFLVAATITYLLLVDVAKRWLFAHTFRHS
jgi:Mg2+-importing ATPase